MLKILCCVKQVPDVDRMQMDPETGNLIRAGVPAILNPQDANALAAAVKVKEQYGAEITLITMGPPNAEAALRECLAVGADKAVLVTDRAFGNADTLATSYSIMSAAATQGSYDMIFCGKESLDGATGQMGAQLAQRFGAAQVSSTLLIKEVDEEAKAAVVERELEDGIETLEVKLPCLFTIEKQNYPARIPNLKGKMAAKKAVITTITSNDIPGLDRERIGDAGSPTKVPRMFPPVMPEPGVIIDEGSAEANSAKLLGGKLAGTRPVVDRELLPYKLQVGQSGVMVKPKLYIGFGVSGAVNHVTGVDAELFIAVNKDANAPIFNYCDYGVVGDMDEVCDHMIELLKQDNS